MTRHDRRTALGRLGAAAALAGTWPLARAQAGWPTRASTIVSPYNPGGTNDVVARLIADRLQKALGQPFSVENKAGAAGIVGATAVMRAAADGHTLLSGNNGAMVVQAVAKTPAPYDPATQFTPIVKIADAANFVGISADLPVKTVGELIAYARQRPGQLNYSSAGSGSFGNFMGEYFKQQTGTFMVHIPGRGSASALNEMMAGRIHVMFDPLVLSQRQSGRVRVLATTQSARVDAYPDIPTVKESGGPAMEIVGWFGLLGPAGLPAEVVQKIEGVARALMTDADARAGLTAAGLIPAVMGSAEFTKLVRDDMKRYAEIQQRARITVE